MIAKKDEQAGKGRLLSRYEICECGAKAESTQSLTQAREEDSI